MRYIQKGPEVTIARLLSFILMLGIASCLLLYTIGMWFSFTEGNTVASMLAATFFYGLFVGGMSIFAVYNYWRFPRIMTTEQELQLQFPLHTLGVDWKSVVRLQRKNHRLLIFLQRKGLLLNRLYGLFYAKTWDQPLVLFVSSPDKISDLEEDIKKRLQRIG